MVDFHVHSVFSDGTDKIEDIVFYAYNNAFKYLSITDHDTFLSQDEALRLCNKKLNYITGIEISAEYPLTLHILGYNYDLNNDYFKTEISKLKEYRDRRNEKIVKNFRNLGYDITLEEVIREAKGNIVGRPHFASVLVKKGYFATREEVFDRYLSKGKPAYENKLRFSIEKSIDLIHNAGGLAIWAHPYSAVTDEDNLLVLLKKMISLGIDGIEVYYSSYPYNMVMNLKRLSERFGLIATAGSDYHGLNKTIPLGVDVDLSSIEKFLQRLK